MKKRILCFGDSNTYGAIPFGAGRYDENTRWTRVLQNLLGNDYEIIEEGLNGRTTIFTDPAEGVMSGIDYITPCLISHSPLDLIIIMLGTNDTKERFGVDGDMIAYCAAHLIDAARNARRPSGPVNPPDILLVSPILIFESYFKTDLKVYLGKGCAQKTLLFADEYKKQAQLKGCHFIDAAKFAQPHDEEGVHMDAKNHLKLAHAFSDKIKEILG